MLKKMASKPKRRRPCPGLNKRDTGTQAHIHRYGMQKGQELGARSEEPGDIGQERVTDDGFGESNSNCKFAADFLCTFP